MLGVEDVNWLTDNFRIHWPDLGDMIPLFKSKPEDDSKEPVMLVQKRVHW